MDAATVVLLVIVGVIVAAIALHLILIAASLAKVAGTLKKVKGGVVAIKGQTDPVGEVIGGIAGDVAAIDDDLEGLLVIVGEAQAAAARRPAAAPAAVDPDDLVDFEDDVAPRPTMREAVARARSSA
jgi:pyruvate/2-oxoglutarate dehydrogenase complex dihydrolipoamide acyltransferase (E2) component